MMRLTALLLLASSSRLANTFSLSSFTSQRNPMHLGMVANIDNQRSSSKQKILLTFDLDDTLFPTGRVVDESNAIMVDYLIDQSGKPTTVDDFLQTTRTIRQNLRKSSSNAAMTYTDLRKAAIRADLERVGMTDIPDTLVEDTFDVWLDARQRLANDYLFDGAVEMLEDIRQTYKGRCMIAAITNGRGDPREMPRLAPYFEFCISGEDDNVFPNRKPHPGIYKAALECYRDGAPQDENEPQDVDVDFRWCHVGDCLANDVGASASCGAFAVWYCPEDEETVDTAASRLVGGKQPGWSTATAADLEERARQASEAREKVAARIRHLSELPKVLDDYVRTTPISEEVSTTAESRIS